MFFCSEAARFQPVHPKPWSGSATKVIFTGTNGLNKKRDWQIWGECTKSSSQQILWINATAGTLWKKKKYDPLLKCDIHTCRSVCLFIYRGATRIRRGAGNERRHQRKGEDDNSMNNGAIKQEKDMQEGGRKVLKRKRGIMRVVFQAYTNRKLILPGYTGYP